VGEPERFHCLDRIRKRIARPRNAHHCYLWPLCDYFGKIGDGLLGLEDAAGHAGPALVHAIEFSVAEIALDVASRRDGQMDATVFIVRIAVETGVLREIDSRRG
jgi:hypothetical protein